MTNNETKLIELIRNHPNPEEAICVAVEIIAEYLKHLRLSEGDVPVYPQALHGTTSAT
jgi:hypothetical protein